MWQLCSAWVPALCSCWCTSARAAAVCHSLCEFVFKEAHVRSAMFVFRQRTRVTFPCGALPNLFQSYPRFYFRYRQPKKCVENQKPCSLFCHYFFFFFWVVSLLFCFSKIGQKDNESGVWILPLCVPLPFRFKWCSSADHSRKTKVCWNSDTFELECGCEWLASGLRPKTRLKSEY